MLTWGCSNASNPKMKLNFLLFPLLSVCAFAQPAVAPEPKPETVLAIVDGYKVRYGEVDAYFRGIGAEARKNAFANLPAMIQQYALSLRLLEYAKADKLEDKSPYKEALDSSRKVVLIQAALNEGSLKVKVTQEEQKKYYEANKDRFTEAKVQVLYLGFVADPQASAKTTPGKKYRSEEEAKAKAEELRKSIHTREDFVKAVKAFSEDETSKNNDGDFGIIRKSDNVPPDIKQVVFTMKTGEVSGPVQQKNGFYLFRIDQTMLEAYDTVKDTIYGDLQNQKARAWIEELRNRPIEIVDKGFFADKTAK
jgi:peptidyl-prolyl cis-trans isomerase C